MPNCVMPRSAIGTMSRGAMRTWDRASSTTGIRQHAPIA
jgi:hypothetical protein